MNDKKTRKKMTFSKVVIWLLGIIVALQVISGGAYFEQIYDVFQTPEQSDPAYSTQNVYTAYIGLSGQDTQDNTGVVISSVVTGGPGEKAGIQVGDIITAIGTHAVRNSVDFKSAIAACAPWECVEVFLLRDGVALTLNAVLEMKPELIAPPHSQIHSQVPENPVTIPPETSWPHDNTEMTNRYPSLPSDLREHVLIGSRDIGISATLTGDVLITVILVNDPTSTWTTEDIANVKTGDAAVKAQLISEASSYGAQLNITLEYLQVTVDTTEEADSQSWAEEVIFNAGLGSLATASAELERTRGVKEAPILLYVNAKERSYSRPNNGEYTEYAIIWDYSAFTVQHELSHLFGAADFYMPSEVEKCADRYWPNSIMLSEKDFVTDDLTAYLIGWTNTLSDNALAFLYETAHITPKDVADEYEKQCHTGYVENWEVNGDYITGYLDFGILEGEGKVIYADGGWEEGYFEFGSFIRGQCKILYADGGWYEGDYDYGVAHGKGKALYADGSYYEGDFVKGVLEGQGTIVWADGSTYTGQWKNSQYHGYGTHSYADGSSITGNWNYGEFIG